MLTYTPDQYHANLANESKLWKQNFNANAIDVENSTSVTLTLIKQQHLYNVN